MAEETRVTSPAHLCCHLRAPRRSLWPHWFPLCDRDLFFACLDGVILLGVVRDLLVNRSIHKVYLVALPLLMVSQYFVIHIWRGAPSWWLSFAHTIVA
jgi:hypothetical protein